MEDTKTCIKCGQVKPLSEFYFSRERGSHRSDCDACRHEQQKRNYQSNREQLIAQQAAYYEANREKCKESHKRYVEAHKEERAAYMAAYRERTKSKRVEYDAARYQKNRPQTLEAKKQYRENNRDAILARNNKRKTLQRGAAISDFTPKQWIEMKQAFDHRCAYCGDETAKLTMDHVVPLAKGGQHTASNIVPACMACNNRKKCRPAPPMVVTPDWSKVQTP